MKYISNNHTCHTKQRQPATRFMTNVTCRLTAKKPGSAPCPTLVIEYGTVLLYMPQEQLYMHDCTRYLHTDKR